MANPTKPDWEALSHKPGFQALLDAKKRFIVPSCIFFLLFYAALLYLVGWHPDLMKKPIIGKINGAYLFALSQFFMAWGMAWLYMRKAAAFDRMAAEVIRDEKH
jgi:uncharacterized membrane protein (DUF485 family)